MSDIAPFVAATIRDKVVVDLLDENRKLRDDLEKARAVAITGPNGAPVYATASFASGEYAGNPNLWKVKFAETQSVALADWRDLEIHALGILKAKFFDGSYFDAFLDENEDDGENQKAVNICYNDRYGVVWFSFLVQGWPEARWRVAVVRSRLRGQDDNVVLDVAEELDRVAEQFPDAVVSNMHVSFCVETVQGAIDALSLDQSMEVDLERRREEHELFGIILGRMRDAGDEEVGEGFLRRGSLLFSAAQALGVDQQAEEFENTVNLLIHLMGQVGEGEAFHSAVQQMLDRLDNSDE